MSKSITIQQPGTYMVSAPAGTSVTLPDDDVNLYRNSSNGLAVSGNFSATNISSTTYVNSPAFKAGAIHMTPKVVEAQEYFISPEEGLILVDTTDFDSYIYLPDEPSDGMIITVKKIASDNQITIGSCSPNQEIDGCTEFLMDIQYACMTFAYSAEKDSWFVV